MTGGARGPRGRPGPQGEPGAFPRRVTRSFVAIVLAAFVVTTVLAYDINQNRKAIRQLKVVAAAQREFRIERARRTSATDVLICRQVNKVKAVIRAVVVPRRADLLKLAYYQQHPREVAIAVANGRKVAARFAPTNCTTLPTSKGGAFPKKHRP